MHRHDYFNNAENLKEQTVYSYIPTDPTTKYKAK